VGEPAVRQVSFERDAVDDAAAETERLPGDPVRAVGPDDGVDLHRRSIDPEPAVRLDLDADAVAEDRTGLNRLVDEERVETAPLRHQAKDTVRLPLHHRPVLETATNARDPVLHDGLDRDRELPHRASRETTAARLVAGETDFVY
jgi:hypothetical protein